MNTLAANLVSRLLNRYIDGNFKEMLDVNVFSGVLVLTDATIKKAALEGLDLPFDVSRGVISKLTLRIPWASLKTRPAELLIDGVKLLAVPRDHRSRTWSAEEEKKRLQDRKMERLNTFEEVRASKEGRSGGAGWSAKLMELVVANIRVHVQNVHVRFEDYSAKDAFFALGFVWDTMTLTPTTEDWESVFLTELGSNIHKAAELKNFRVYLRSILSSSAELTHADWCGYMAHREAASGGRLGEVLGPLDATLKISQLTYAGLEDDSKSGAPFIESLAQVRLLKASLSKEQYDALLRLASFLTHFSVCWDYALMRPAATVMEDPKAWWVFAKKCVINAVRKLRVDKDKVREGRRKIKAEYVDAWMAFVDAGRKLSGLSTKRQRFLDACEKGLPAMELISYRVTAYRILDRRKKQEKEEKTLKNKEKARRKPQSAWSFMSRDRSASKTEHTDPAAVDPSLEGSFSKPSNTHNPFPPTEDSSPKLSMRRRVYSFEIPDFELSLRSDIASEPMAILKCQGLTVNLSDTRVDCTIISKIQSMTLTDTYTKNGKWPVVLGPDATSNSKVNNSRSILAACYAFSKPAAQLHDDDQPLIADSSITLQTSRSMTLVLNSAYLAILARFFTPPPGWSIIPSGLNGVIPPKQTTTSPLSTSIQAPSSTMHKGPAEFASMAKSLEPGFKANMQDVAPEVADALEDRPTCDVKIVAAAPTVVFPRDCVAEATDALVLKLGNLRVSSRLHAAEKAELRRKAAERDLEEHDVFEWWDIHIRGLRASVRPCKDGIVLPGSHGTDVLSDTGVVVQFGSSLLPARFDVPLMITKGKFGPHVQMKVNHATVSVVTALTIRFGRLLYEAALKKKSSALSASDPIFPGQPLPKSKCAPAAIIALETDLFSLDLDLTPTGTGERPPACTLRVMNTETHMHVPRQGLMNVTAFASVLEVLAPDGECRAPTALVQAISAPGRREPIFTLGHRKSGAADVSAIFDHLVLQPIPAALRRAMAFFAPYTLSVPVVQESLERVAEAQLLDGDLFIRGPASLSSAKVAFGPKNRLLVEAEGLVTIDGAPDTRPCAKSAQPGAPEGEPDSFRTDVILLDGDSKGEPCIVIAAQAKVVFRNIRFFCQRRLEDSVMSGSGPFELENCVVVSQSEDDEEGSKQDSEWKSYGCTIAVGRVTGNLPRDFAVKSGQLRWVYDWDGERALSSVQLADAMLLSPPVNENGCSSLAAEMLERPLSLVYETCISQCSDQSIESESSCTVSVPQLRGTGTDFVLFNNSISEVYAAVWPPEAPLSVAWKDTLNLALEGPCTFALCNTRGGISSHRVCVTRTDSLPSLRSVSAHLETSLRGERDAASGSLGEQSIGQSANGKPGIQDSGSRTTPAVGEAEESPTDKSTGKCLAEPSRRLKKKRRFHAASVASSPDAVRLDLTTEAVPKQAVKRSTTANFYVAVQVWQPSHRDWTSVLCPSKANLEITDTPTGMPPGCGHWKKSEFLLNFPGVSMVALSNSSIEALVNLFGTDRAVEGPPSVSFWNETGLPLEVVAQPKKPTPAEGTQPADAADLVKYTVRLETASSPWILTFPPATDDPPSATTHICTALRQLPATLTIHRYLSITAKQNRAKKYLSGVFSLVPFTLYNRNPVWRAGLRRLYFSNNRWHITHAARERTSFHTDPVTVIYGYAAVPPPIFSKWHQEEYVANARPISLNLTPVGLSQDAIAYRCYAFLKITGFQLSFETESDIAFDDYISDVCLSYGVPPVEWCGHEPPGLVRHRLNEFYAKHDPEGIRRVPALVGHIMNGRHTVEHIVELLCRKWSVDEKLWQGDFPKAVRPDGMSSQVCEEPNRNEGESEKKCPDDVPKASCEDDAHEESDDGTAEDKPCDDVNTSATSKVKGKPPRPRHLTDLAIGMERCLEENACIVEAGSDAGSVETVCEIVPVLVARDEAEPGGRSRDMRRCDTPGDPRWWQEIPTLDDLADQTPDDDEQTEQMSLASSTHHRSTFESNEDLREKTEPENGHRKSPSAEAESHSPSSAGGRSTANDATTLQTGENSAQEESGMEVSRESESCPIPSMDEPAEGETTQPARVHVEELIDDEGEAKVRQPVSMPEKLFGFDAFWCENSVVGVPVFFARADTETDHGRGVKQVVSLRGPVSLRNTSAMAIHFTVGLFSFTLPPAMHASVAMRVPVVLAYCEARSFQFSPATFSSTDANNRTLGSPQMSSPASVSTVALIRKVDLFTTRDPPHSPSLAVRPESSALTQPSAFPPPNTVVSFPNADSSLFFLFSTTATSNGDASITIESPIVVINDLPLDVTVAFSLVRVHTIVSKSVSRGSEEAVHEVSPSHIDQLHAVVSATSPFTGKPQTSVRVALSENGEGGSMEEEGGRLRSYFVLSLRTSRERSADELLVEACFERPAACFPDAEPVPLPHSGDGSDSPQRHSCVLHLFSRVWVTNGTPHSLSLQPPPPGTPRSASTPLRIFTEALHMSQFQPTIDPTSPSRSSTGHASSQSPNHNTNCSLPRGLPVPYSYAWAPGENSIFINDVPIEAQPDSVTKVFVPDGGCLHVVIRNAAGAQSASSFSSHREVLLAPPAVVHNVTANALRVETPSEVVCVPSGETRLLRHALSGEANVCRLSHPHRDALGRCKPTEQPSVENVKGKRDVGEDAALAAPSVPPKEQLVVGRDQELDTAEHAEDDDLVAIAWLPPVSVAVPAPGDGAKNVCLHGTWAPLSATVDDITESLHITVGTLHPAVAPLKILNDTWQTVRVGEPPSRIVVPAFTERFVHLPDASVREVPMWIGDREAKYTIQMGSAEEVVAVQGEMEGDDEVVVNVVFRGRVGASALIQIGRKDVARMENEEKQPAGVWVVKVDKVRAVGEANGVPDRLFEGVVRKMLFELRQGADGTIQRAHWKVDSVVVDSQAIQHLLQAGEKILQFYPDAFPRVALPLRYTGSPVASLEVIDLPPLTTEAWWRSNGLRALLSVASVQADTSVAKFVELAIAAAIAPDATARTDAFFSFLSREAPALARIVQASPEGALLTPGNLLEPERRGPILTAALLEVSRLSNPDELHAFGLGALRTLLKWRFGVNADQATAKGVATAVIADVTKARWGTGSGVLLGFVLRHVKVADIARKLAVQADAATEAGAARVKTLQALCSSSSLADFKRRAQAAADELRDQQFQEAVDEACTANFDPKDVRAALLEALQPRTSPDQRQPGPANTDEAQPEAQVQPTRVSSSATAGGQEESDEEREVGRLVREVERAAAGLLDSALVKRVLSVVRDAVEQEAGEATPQQQLRRVAAAAARAAGAEAKQAAAHPLADGRDAWLAAALSGPARRAAAKGEAADVLAGARSAFPDAESAPAAVLAFRESLEVFIRDDDGNADDADNPQSADDSRAALVARAKVARQEDGVPSELASGIERLERLLGSSSDGGGGGGGFVPLAARALLARVDGMAAQGGRAGRAAAALRRDLAALVSGAGGGDAARSVARGLAEFPEEGLPAPFRVLRSWVGDPTQLDGFPAAAEAVRNGISRVEAGAARARQTLAGEGDGDPAARFDQFLDGASEAHLIRALRGWAEDRAHGGFPAAAEAVRNGISRVEEGAAAARRALAGGDDGFDQFSQAHFARVRTALRSIQDELSTADSELTGLPPWVQGRLASLQRSPAAESLPAGVRAALSQARGAAAAEGGRVADGVSRALAQVDALESLTRGGDGASAEAARALLPESVQAGLRRVGQPGEQGAAPIVDWLHELLDGVNATAAAARREVDNALAADGSDAARRHLAAAAAGSLDRFQTDGALPGPVLDALRRARDLVSSAGGQGAARAMAKAEAQLLGGERGAVGNAVAAVQKELRAFAEGTDTLGSEALGKARAHLRSLVGPDERSSETVVQKLAALEEDGGLLEPVRDTLRQARELASVGGQGVSRALAKVEAMLSDQAATRDAVAAVQEKLGSFVQGKGEAAYDEQAQGEPGDSTDHVDTTDAGDPAAQQRDPTNHVDAAVHLEAHDKQTQGEPGDPKDHANTTDAGAPAAQEEDSTNHVDAVHLEAHDEQPQDEPGDPKYGANTTDVLPTVQHALGESRNSTDHVDTIDVVAPAAEQGNPPKHVDAAGHLEAHDETG
ncbi:putative vacuolar protein sorting-associated protein 13B [Diplonema papillatum]|nr:putative vacuolar protein sorting-associated protein 13B [Diplonema papillatum]